MVRAEACGLGDRGGGGFGEEGWERGGSPREFLFFEQAVAGNDELVLGGHPTPVGGDAGGTTAGVYGGPAAGAEGLVGALGLGYGDVDAASVRWEGEDGGLGEADDGVGGGASGG